LKEDLLDFESKPIFTNRYPKTIKFILSERETRLYNDLSYYVISQYNLAVRRIKERKRRMQNADGRRKKEEGDA